MKKIVIVTFISKILLMTPVIEYPSMVVIMASIKHFVFGVLQNLAHFHDIHMTYSSTDPKIYIVKRHYIFFPIVLYFFEAGILSFYGFFWSEQVTYLKILRYSELCSDEVYLFSWF